MSLVLELDGWVDGERVRATVRPPPLDRWQLHAADEARVTVRARPSSSSSGGGASASASAASSSAAALVSVSVRQKPQSIPASRMGVGAVFWEGELALAAFLACQPRHRWQGQSVVELGAGPGLAGLVVARMMAGEGNGAGRVVISDLGKVVPLIRENVALNGFSGEGGGKGVQVLAAELEWGREGYLEEATAVARLANGGREGGGKSGGGKGGGGGDGNDSSKNNNAGGVDWVIAADVNYVDGDGASPSTEHFVRCCHALSGPRTRVIVALEVRVREARDDLARHGALLFERAAQLKGDALPRGFCREAGEHLEVYEFGGPRRL
jgi:hypothetical protein